MKVTVEAESEDEAKQLVEPKVFSTCMDFALCGRRINELGLEQSFSFIHQHSADRYWLIGKMTEVKERLLG